MVAEGEVSEPDYCTALNNRFKDEHQFYINTRYSRKNGLHPLEVAEQAITIASDPRERSGSGPVHEVWANGVALRLHVRPSCDAGHKRHRFPAGHRLIEGC
ncbi:MAG TPA: hypothetical protein VFO01_06165 [Trebonia sp.]|nr:hypothetical protein [Trebonia sp.]